MAKQLIKRLSSFTQRAMALAEKEVATEFEQDNTPWWGTCSIDSQQARFWRIGDIILCLDRCGNEWHIGYASLKQLRTKKRHGDEVFLFKTFTFQNDLQVALKPVMPDRHLCTHLDRPLYIPGGENVLLYVGSPIWVHVETHKPRFVLDDISTSVLSDTWWGSNTLEGILCYAGDVACSTTLDDLPQGSDRIISPMFIKNLSKETLTLKNMIVVSPYLSVYADPNYHLWTEQLNLVREKSDKAAISFTKGPPRSSKQLMLMATARKKNVKTTTAFKHLFETLTRD